MQHVTVPSNGWGRIVLCLHTLCFYAKGSSHSNKVLHYEGRVEASLCPPAVPSNDHPHENAGLISGWILEGSQSACVPLLKNVQDFSNWQQTWKKQVEWTICFHVSSSQCGYIPSPSVQSPRHHSSILWWATRGRENRKRGRGGEQDKRRRGGCYNTRHTCIRVFRPCYNADISDIF